MRTWDARARDHAEGEPLDVRHYEAIGTMKGALSQHAEEAYSDLKSARAEAIAERLFKTITETTEEGRGVRRPTPLGTIAEVCGAAEAEVAGVVETFRQAGRAFLQPPAGVGLESDSIIDISHESLMRLWERLVGWTKQEGVSTGIYKDLSRSARRHEAGKESLWRNPQLQIGLRWREENHPTAAWAGDEADFARSMRFLDRSRRAHLLRRAALAAAVLLVIAGLAWWVYLQHLENKRQQLENRRLADEAVLLNEQIARLQRERQAEQAQVEEGAQELSELRERNEQLEAGVAAAQKRREALNANIKALREDNQNVEQKIAVLNKDNKELAVAALRLAPFDPEDPTHPSVYNALWLALNRLDEKAAWELIKPSANRKGKIGTTTTEVLAREICSRVRRGFTQDEWKRFFPPRPYEQQGQSYQAEADIKSPLGDPCKPPPPSADNHLTPGNRPS